MKENGEDIESDGGQFMQSCVTYGYLVAMRRHGLSERVSETSM